jgi:hypothetical protein
MITVITRLYGDEASGRGIRERLYRQGFPRHALTLITPADADGKSALQARIERALVPEEAAKVYAARVAKGDSLVVVRATYKPLNAVRIAKETFRTSGALDSGIDEEAFRVKSPPDHAPSILKDHPLFLTLPPDPERDARPVSERLGLRLLSHPKRRDSVMRTPKRFFGEGIIRKRESRSVLAPGTFVSKTFWPMPLLSERKPGRSVIPGGGQPFSRLFGWPTVSENRDGK